MGNRLNLIGLDRNDYKGNKSTLCLGCGHNSIANQIIQVAYELSINPHRVVKLSGIGCSSKSPAYFLNRSHGFNGLHGRMPALATGVTTVNRDLLAIGVSGDGDTGSIGLGQFKHMIRRNVPVVYIVENNGVYGLTKGILSKPGVRGLFVCHNITNNTQVDVLAMGIVRALRELGIDPATFPVVVREAGVNDAQAREIFTAAGVEYYGDEITMTEAAARMVARMREAYGAGERGR